MILEILAVLAMAIVLFLMVAALQPGEFRIARSATIAAPPAVVFEQVNDLHKWEKWSPWMKLDPDAKHTYEGPGDGTGAIFRWAGNAKVGEGSMTVTASKPAELIAIRLDFLKPFASTNIAEFTFKPEGAATAVTWSMTGRNSFVPKIFCMFMSMDKMVGGQFEKGLADLKSVSEAAGGK